MTNKKSKTDKLIELLMMWGWLLIFPSAIALYFIYLEYSSQGKGDAFFIIGIGMACVWFLFPIIVGKGFQKKPLKK